MVEPEHITLVLLEVLDMSLTVNMSLSRFWLVVRNVKQWFSSVSELFTERVTVTLIHTRSDV